MKSVPRARCCHHPTSYINVNWCMACLRFAPHCTSKLNQIQYFHLGLVTPKPPVSSLGYAHALMWLFVNNGFFLSTLPHSPQLCRELEMVVWSSFISVSATALCNSFLVIVGLTVVSFTSLCLVFVLFWGRTLSWQCLGYLIQLPLPCYWSNSAFWKVQPLRYNFTLYA